MKSDKDALTVGEDGFLGPFANEGDKVSWQVQAPWSGQFLLNVTFNGKWGGKQLICRQRGRSADRGLPADG